MAKKYPIRLSETIFDILELKELGATNEACGKIIAARYGRSTPFAESSIRFVLEQAEQTEQAEGEETDNVESEEQEDGAEAEAEADTPATSKKKETRDEEIKQEVKEYMDKVEARLLEIENKVRKEWGFPPVDSSTATPHWEEINLIRTYTKGL